MRFAMKGRTMISLCPGPRDPLTGNDSLEEG